MAEAAVNFAIGTLGSMLLQELNLLGGVKKEIEEIKSELESLRSFLKDADATAEEEIERDERVKTWVKQVRKEAYRIEDVIDEYLLKEAQLTRGGGSGLYGVLHKISRLIKKSKLRRHTASEIKDIKSSLSEIRRRGEDYSFSFRDPFFGPRKFIPPHDPRFTPFFINDDEVVGIESTRDKLIDWLVNKRLCQLSVIGLVGTGGLGKTLLAQKVIQDKAVINHFHFQAWISINGKEPTQRDLLKGMIKEFYLLSKEPAPAEMDKMDVKDLITTLREHLKEKTYLVVFDDVRKIEFWRDIRHALPDKNKSSRVMLTTRNMGVINFCKQSSFVQVHELETLPPDESWRLFCRNAFRCSPYSPKRLEKLSHEIVAKCGGLPLAIITIGGLLSTKNEDVSEWQKLLDGMGSMLRSDPQLKRCNRVLSEGYYDLPHHLKLCLLYFALVPESDPISCAVLIRLWIAEGFVQCYNHLRSEEVAEEYLNVLIDRSLVHVSKRNSLGRPKSCRVQGLMYDIILRKARELGFCRYLNEEESSHCSKTRRISIRGNTCGVLQSVKESKIRSIFVFNVDKLPDSFMTAIVADFKLMKVLKFEDAPLEYLPDEVGNLFHLHYLSARNTKVKKLPKSIGKLLNLQTLDLEQSLVSELPVEIKNLKKLQYLLVSHSEYTDTVNYVSNGVKIQKGFGALKELQKLSFVEINSDGVHELGKLGRVRKLGIRLTKGHGKDLCASIANMKHLVALRLESENRGENLNIQCIDPTPSLRFLYLKGNLKNLPVWIPRLQNLVRVSLSSSGLADDPMGMLQALPKLSELTLNQVYNGEQLHLKAGWFPELKTFSLWEFKGLKSMIFDKGSMPSLTKLGIGSCPLLKEIPTGIENLRYLHTLHFHDMLREIYCMIKENNWEKLTNHITKVYVTFKKAGEDVLWHTKFISSQPPQVVEQTIVEMDSTNELLTL